VATCIVEVRDGRVTNYSGQYDAYVAKVNEEIEAGERELASDRAKLPAAVLAKPTKVVHRTAQRSEKEIRRELKTVEKTIAQLDQQKKTLNAQLLETSNAKEALRLHNESTEVTTQLDSAEERWVSLSNELEEM